MRELLRAGLDLWERAVHGSERVALPMHQAARIQLVRCVIARFAPITEAGFSAEWEAAMAEPARPGRVG